MSRTPPLALTMGEPAGIGGEIALMAWLRRRPAALPPFVLLDDPDRIRALAALLGLAVTIQPVTAPEAVGEAFDRALPVLPVRLPKPVAPGRPDPANAPAVLESLDRAVVLAQAGRVAGLVTNPIQKHTLYAAGFRHPGHTEYIAEKTGAGAHAMMLAVEGLRVVLATIHLALRDAIAALNADAIVAAGRIAASALMTDFAIARPRLAVAALNPHAGEGGALGREEGTIIAPAVARLQALGIDAFGPAPADTLFHAEARARYDAALCMYHDQALIPLKTIDFDRGVNITLGLPIVRTSPDHGTALGIAGTGAARPDSLIAALQTAAAIAARRAAAPVRA